MKKTILFLLLALSQCLAAQNLQTDLSLKYLVTLPTEKTEKLPVIILLHGYGSNESDLISLGTNLSKSSLIISVRAPMPISENAFQWFPIGKDADATESTRLLAAFIPEIVKKHKADPKNVTLIGFSQGAMMCYQIGLRHPELVKAIAPLSGRILPTLKAKIKPGTNLKNLKVFIAHGDADNRVPYAEAVAAEVYLKTLKNNPEFKTYKNLQHSIGNEEISDLKLWLNK